MKKMFSSVAKQGGFHNRPHLAADCCETRGGFIRGGFHINSSDPFSLIVSTRVIPIQQAPRRTEDLVACVDSDDQD